jgi:5'-3' exonuclease
MKKKYIREKSVLEVLNSGLGTNQSDGKKTLQKTIQISDKNVNLQINVEKSIKTQIEEEGESGEEEGKECEEGEKEGEKGEGREEEGQGEEDIVISCNRNLDCMHNMVSLDNNICLVDLSYMIFTRFFAIRKWYEIKYNKDKPDWKIPNNHNWLEDDEFMTKYHKLFFEKLFDLCYKNNIPNYNIIFIMDCRHNNNWRVKLQNDYKGTRKDSHEKNRFFSYGIFDYVKNKLITELQEESRNIVMNTNNLEADDVIACLVTYFKNRKYKKNITILTSDKDYFQLCNSKKINCFDLSGKNISYNTLKNFNNNALDYLIFKILIGDPSDNIPSCYVSKEFLKMANINTNKKYLKCSKIIIEKILKVENCKKILIDYIYYIRDIKTIIPYSINNEVNEVMEVNEVNKVMEVKDKWCDKIYMFHSIIENKQFESNAVLIDFENIPLKYRNDINELFDKLFK